MFTRSAVLLVALLAVATTSARAFDGPDTSPAKEKELLAILRSDAPAAEKALACKHLAVHGSPAAVPDLAKLLPNPQLSSWARTSLEVIPGEAADQALLTASESLEGRLLVGMINSIGFRRNANAVESLTAKLQNSDADVASGQRCRHQITDSSTGDCSCQRSFGSGRRLRAVCRTLAQRRQCCRRHQNL